MSIRHIPVSLDDKMVGKLEIVDNSEIDKLFCGGFQFYISAEAVMVSDNDSRCVSLRLRPVEVIESETWATKFGK